MGAGGVVGGDMGGCDRVGVIYNVHLYVYIDVHIGVMKGVLGGSCA